MQFIVVRIEVETELTITCNEKNRKTTSSLSLQNREQGVPYINFQPANNRTELTLLIRSQLVIIVTNIIISEEFLFIEDIQCWRRMEKISWTDHVRNEEVLLRVNEQRNILHEIRKRKANQIGHILRRNCLLQRVIKGKIKGGIELTGRRRRRRKKLLDELKEREDTLI